MKAPVKAVRHVLLMLGMVCAVLVVRPAQAQDGPEDPVDVEAADGESVGLAEPPAGPPLTDEAAIDALTSETSSGLRCPVCQGLSVNDSPADGARAMKARIRELVTQGYSREQIEDYFVDRYGVWVLLAPPDQGRHLAVWLGPVAFLLAGVGVIGVLLRTRAQPAAAATAQDAAPAPDAAPAQEPAPAQAAPPAQPPAAPDALEPYRRRILAELGLAPGEQP